jgi:DNA helicase-2/ATP-dependent DNA helicase PcrA
MAKIAKGAGVCKCGARFAAGATVGGWTRDGSAWIATSCPACANGAAPRATASEEAAGEVAEVAAREEAPIAVPTAQAALDAYTTAILRLDGEQRAVAAWNPGDGALRVLAAAGSGKTATTVALIARLVRERVAAPGEIVATTFTSKAGRELVERLARVLPPGAIDVSGRQAPGTVRAGTFHGLALRALRRTGAAWDMSRCMDIGKGRAAHVPGTSILWAKVLGYAGPEGLPGTGAEGLGMEEPDAKAYALAVDVLRSKGLTGEALREALAVTEREDGLAYLVKAFDLFAASKAAVGGWDFADALQEFHDGLASGFLTDGARVVIVDEAQDNSQIQIEVARLLARRGEIIVVGDARQSIYSWRGAYPHLFIHADTMLGARTLEITTNYRSVGAVVDVGNAVAHGEEWSVGAPSRSARGAAGEAGLVTVTGYGDPAEEAEATAEAIDLAIREGASAGDFAVLCRTNAQSGAYEAALVAAKIPCVVVGGTPFFARKEVKDVLAYVALTVRDDAADLGRIVNRPKRYLGKKFTAAVEFALSTRGGTILDAIDRAAEGLYSRQKEAAYDLGAFLADLRAAEWPATVDRIVNLLAPTETSAQGEADADRSGIVAAVAQVARGFDSAQAFRDCAARCAGEVAAVANADNGVNAADVAGRVTISTIHKAKGLEWKEVFVTASAGTFPHARSTSDARMAEEKRLFYVAATRARDTLHLTYSAVDLRDRPAGASPFLAFAPTPPAPTGTDGDEGGGESIEGDDAADLGAHATMHSFDTAGEAPAVAEAVAEVIGDMAAAVGFTPDAAAPEAPTLPAGALPAEAVLFGDDAWRGACLAASAATAAEPAATGGEGGRYVTVREEAFAGLLLPLGFERADEAAERKAKQVVFEAHRPLPGVSPHGRAVVRVYTTIPVGDDTAREVGEDSIKVAALWYDDRDGVLSPLHKRLPYACRTRGWRETLLRRIAEVATAAVQATGKACSRCAAPTVERTRRADGVTFKACVRFCAQASRDAAAPAPRGPAARGPFRRRPGARS